MKRALLLALAIIQPAAPLMAAEPFVEGVAYKLVVPPQPTASDGKVEVVEIFWYGCPHCFRLQPTVKAWLAHKPDNVEYIRLPAVLSSKWEIHARAYYTAEALGIVEKIHQPLFDAIHIQKRPLNTEDELRDFFGEFGVSAEAFTDVFHSFAVNTKVRRAKEMTRRYGVTGTPTIVVDGKYRTGPKEAQGSFETMMQIVDFLIQKEGGAG